MSISVLFINGARGSACNNDAWSVVSQEQGEQQRVLTIIPAYEVPGKTGSDIEEAFLKAALDRKNNSDEAIKADAFQRLGLTPG